MLALTRLRPPPDLQVRDIIDLATDGDVPVVYALTRRKLGKALSRRIRVSIVGVLNFDGADGVQNKVSNTQVTLTAAPVAGRTYGHSHRALCVDARLLRLPPSCESRFKLASAWVKARPTT